MKKEIIEKERVIEKCMPVEVITEYYNTPNALYTSSLEILEATTENHFITPLLVSNNNMFKLDSTLTLVPDGLFISDSAYTIDEICKLITERLYNLNIEGLSNNAIQSICYMDTALCILFRQDETPIFVTRNPTVINSLKCVPGCKIWDAKGYFDITQQYINSGSVTAAFISPTNEGYQIKYEMVDLRSNRYVIIPYLWYCIFYNDMLRKLRSGYVNIKFLHNGTIHTIRGTRCKIIYDSDVRCAVRYIMQHPVNELGKLQFASECGDIYCIDVRDIVSIS